MNATHFASGPALASRLKLAELTSVTQAAPASALYWACWLILGALALYAIARAVTGS